MNTAKSVQNYVPTDSRKIPEDTPFILLFAEVREGAGVHGATSGTWSDIDSHD